MNIACNNIFSSKFWLRFSIWLLFFLFLFVQTYHLATLPGLVGDEGYEGLSVFDHIQDKKPFIIGRESYVAFWSDYVRLPFVLWLGETALAMRIPLIIANCVTFWLAYFVFRRIFDIRLAFFVMVACFFSPPYILYQRISWPINFLPFFAFLLLFVLTRNFRSKPVIAGLIAGLGVSTHVTFTAPIAGIFGAYLLAKYRDLKKIFTWWPTLIGFLAGFGLQLAIMLEMSVESARVGHFSLIIGRLEILYPTLFNYFSGISYWGEYVGDVSHDIARIIIFLLLVFVFCALLIKPHRKVALYWLIGIVISIVATVIMVSYFRTRYLHVTTIALWGLAGLGFGKVLLNTFKSKKVLIPISFLCAILLSFWTYRAVFVPYEKTGGTTLNFQDSGDSWDKSGHFADIQPLANCVKNIGLVFSEEPKISNRLKFLREADQHIKVADERKKAKWFVDYRGPRDLDDPTKLRPGEVCPTVRNFIVIPNDEYIPPKPKNKNNA
ncbi:MAG: glycosyltransferase family 39 protein [bacterium]|nr:glycosyltransferase family 39 protein [bacterium]